MAMEFSKVLFYLTSIFLIQNAFCTDTENFGGDILMRLKYLEDKVVAQGIEIQDVRKTNTQLQMSITEVKETNEDLRETITDLKKTNDDLRESFTELKETNDINLSTDPHLPCTDTQYHQTNLNTAQRKTFSKKDSMSVGKLQRFIMDTEGPVAFTVAITPMVVKHLKHLEIIKFETVITDIGGGYNNQSDVFVAPLTGIYIFSCSLMDDATYGVRVHAEIVQNQRVLGRIFAHAEGNSYRDQGAQTVFTHVNQGDQIWVRAIDNDDLGLGGELYSTFSGYLLHPM